jgi:hypothetical protein
LLHPSSILDGKEAPYLLGRIVADVDDLLQEYVPHDPQQVTKNLPNLEPMEVTSNDVENFLAATKSKDAKVRLAQIFGISSTKSDQASNHVKARIVITRTLRQHQQVFDALMKAHKEDIVNLLKNQSRQRAYMIVGLKTCLNTEFGSSNKSSSGRDIHFQLPLQEAAIAFGVPPLPINLANLSTQVTKENSLEVLSRFLAVGERVFSVRLREVKLHSLFRKGQSIGGILRFPPQQGVFGDGNVMPEIVVPEGADDEEGNVVNLEDVDQDDCAEKMLFAAFRETD